MRIGSGEGLTVRNFIVCTVHLIRDILVVINSRRLRWAGHATRMKEGRSAFIISTDKPTGNRPLGNPRTILEFI